MKSIPMLIKFIGLGSLSLLGIFNAQADLEVGASVEIHAKADFEAPLADCGTWVEVGSYGRCWRPAHVAVDWRPYGSGYWTWTDCGWYWCSDEPWAWACYHYGNWVFESDIGWVWVPGIEWAPAWVSWRFGGDYIGWAPLPPRGFFFAHVAAPSLFVFVDVGHFHDPVRPSTLIVNNTVIINKTTAINNIRRETKNFGGSSQKVFDNEGPGLEQIQRVSHHAFKTVSIREAARLTPVPASVARRFGATSRGVAPSKETISRFHQPEKSPMERKGWEPAKPRSEFFTHSPVPDRAIPPAREPFGRPDHFFGSSRPEPRDAGPMRGREVDHGGDRGPKPGKDHGHDK